MGGDGVGRQRAGLAQPGVGVGIGRRIDVAPLGVGDDDQAGRPGRGNQPLELGQPGRAVALEEGHLRLDHRDRAGERLDAASPKGAQPGGIVSQTPIGQQSARGVDPGAERAMCSDRRCHLVQETVTHCVLHSPARRPLRTRLRRRVPRRPGPGQRRKRFRALERTSSTEFPWPHTTAPPGATPSMAPADRGRLRSPPVRRPHRPATARWRLAPEKTPPTPTRGGRERRRGTPTRPARPPGARGPREATPTGPEDGPARLGVEGQARAGCSPTSGHRRRPPAPRWRSRRCRARWGSAWPNGAGRTPSRASDPGRCLRGVGEHAGAVLDVGAAHVDLDRHDAGACRPTRPPSPRRRGVPRSPPPSDPRC